MKDYNITLSNGWKITAKAANALVAIQSLTETQQTDLVSIQERQTRAKRAG